MRLVPPIAGLTVGLVIWGIGEGLLYLAWWMGHRYSNDKGPWS